MHYVKLFNKTLDSSLWTSSKDAKILFITMALMADVKGNVSIQLPGLAKRADLSREETEAALKILSSPDKYSEDKREEGRRIVPTPTGWHLVTYKAHRELVCDNNRKEYMRNYMKARRNKGKLAKLIPRLPVPEDC
jgi:hypothetical protein